MECVTKLHEWLISCPPIRLSIKQFNGMNAVYETQGRIRRGKIIRIDNLWSQFGRSQQHNQGDKEHEQEP